MNTISTRRAAVAGQFYPGNADELRATVGDLLVQSGVVPAPDAVQAVLVPHAGYVYSGLTAAHAFARCRGKRPTRVVLLGCSHRYAVRTASVYRQGAFETPLGQLPIDDTVAQDLAEAFESAGDEPHALEHSLEVQVPFIQAALGIVPIVPVLFGPNPGPWHAEAGAYLATRLDPGDLVVVSTDLSHYCSDDEAQQIDRASLAVLLSQDIPRYIREVDAGHCKMCGAAAVIAGMACALARGACQWVHLDYRTSAWASGDHRRVVGYAAVSMEQAA